MVNRITRLLSEQWHVTPLYFWRTREGSSIARACPDEGIKAIAAYARRPKITTPGDNEIVMKINDYVLSCAGYLANHGITVFCAVPLVSSLTEYNIDSPCSWFSFVPETECADIEIVIDKATGIAKDYTFQDIVLPIKEQQIPFIIEEQTRKIGLLEAIEIISYQIDFELGNRFSFPLFGPQYKPIYLFLRER
ncbi:hypothetical protein JXI42_00340 [bacterium]|nr:hypothetical protein [bacterium]